MDSRPTNNLIGSPPPASPPPTVAAPIVAPTQPTAANPPDSTINPPGVLLNGSVASSEPSDLISNIPSVTAGRQPWEVIFAVLTVFITLTGVFIVYFLNVSAASQIKRVEATISRLSLEISNPPLAETDKQLTIINTTLRGYNSALANRTNLTDLYEQLAFITPANIKLKTVAVNEKGQVNITARAENFVDAGRALLSFRQSDRLEEVDIINIALNNRVGSEQGVLFDLSAMLRKPAGQAKALNGSASPSTSPLPTSANLDPASQPSIEGSNAKAQN